MSNLSHTSSIFAERVLWSKPSSLLRATDRASKKQGRKRRRIVARVYAPVRTTTDWTCAFSVKADGYDDVLKAYGVDGLQALGNAFAALRDFITATFPDAAWLASQPGDTGLPIVILLWVPFPESEQVRKHLEREAEQIQNSMLVARQKETRTKTKPRKGG